VLQVPLSSIDITQGMEKVQSLRLTRKGLYRWYTNCCNTLMGNTVSAKIPFFGIIHSFYHKDIKRDELLGPVRGAVGLEGAKSGFVKPSHFSSEFGVNLRVVSKLLVWKLKGYSKPSAFFDENGKAISKPIIVNADNTI